MRSHSLLLLVTFAAFSGLAVGACRASRNNPEHCFYARGNQTCAEIDPSRPFCVVPSCDSAAYGCVAELPTEATCQSPCGGALSLVDDSSCIEPADDDSGSEGEPQPDLWSEESEESGDLDCEVHADCPPEAGFCFFGTCTACDGTSDPDSACHELTDGQAPICLDGECVQCTETDVDECVESSLACDFEAHTCIACTAHDQCPGGAACDLPLGTCLPADAVWHVDGDGGQDFTTLGAAMEALDGGSGTIIVHDYEEAIFYGEGIVISGDRSVALFGADGELPWLYFDGATAFEVSGGARVHARRLAMMGTTPMTVTGDSYVDLDACAIGATNGDALTVDDSDLHLHNSMLLSVAPGSVALRLLLSNLVKVRYSTLVGINSAAAIGCTGTASTVLGSSVHNSVLLNEEPTPAVSCPSFPLYDNIVDTTKIYNTAVGDLDMAWFNWDDFPGDLHLTALAPVAFSTTAVWEPGYPTVDFDGDPRPTVEGSTDFAGADRIP